MFRGAYLLECRIKNLEADLQREMEARARLHDLVRRLADACGYKIGFIEQAHWTLEKKS